MPSDELLGVFEMKCGPMWLQVHELYRQNVQLANLRDSLLPRLISGELQIPEEMLVS
jgi:type I restriction enzyme S subunit